MSAVELFIDNDYFVDVGSPHRIKFISNVKNYDVLSEGQAIRYSDRYSQPDQNGLTAVNVNFLKQLDASIASSLASIKMRMQNSSEEKTHHNYTMITYGWNLVVEFHFVNEKFRNITFCGPATKLSAGVYFM